MDSRKKLNIYSQKVFDILKSEFPKYLKYHSKSLSTEGDFFLKIEISSPNKKVENGIYFGTEDEMLTIGFDCFHCHFHQFSDTDFRSEFIKAIETVQSIMNDELFIVKCSIQEEYAGSFLLKKEDLIINEIKKHKWVDSDCDKVKIISWTGKFDSEIIFTSKLNH